MDKLKTEYFRRLLLAELRRHARLVGDDQAAAIDAADDGAKESADLSLRDVIEELALKLGERESQMVADIDQALMRLDEGSYGLCVRCGKTIDERRLEAVPTARYDAICQTAIEQTNGKNERPTI
jgi:DnaK suppressor protein